MPENCCKMSDFVFEILLYIISLFIFRKLWKNTDYTFILTVTSQTREASSQAEQTVVLVAEDIPIVSVEYEIYAVPNFLTFFKLGFFRPTINSPFGWCACICSRFFSKTSHEIFAYISIYRLFIKH